MSSEHAPSEVHSTGLIVLVARRLREFSRLLLKPRAPIALCLLIYDTI